MKKLALYGCLYCFTGHLALADSIDTLAKQDAAYAMKIALQAAHMQLAANTVSDSMVSEPAPEAVQSLPTKAINDVDASTNTTSAVLPAPKIDCNFHIPAETTQIEQQTVLTWATNAAQQSFNFDHQKFNDQLIALKACFTDQGWQGFNDALQKSGNDKAIKSQLLDVSNTVDGKPSLIELKQNQWKASLPLQVMYQNQKEKLTQSLTVDLVIGRNASGDLGIIQLIASPRHTTNSIMDAAPATAK